CGSGLLGLRGTCSHPNFDTSRCQPNSGLRSRLSGTRRANCDFPQGLTPASWPALCGTAEAMPFPIRLMGQLLVINNPLVPQLFEELADVGANLGWIGIGELGLQLCDDLGEGALTVAALQYLPPRALQFDCAFGKQDHAFFAAGLVLCSPAATGGKAGLAGILGRGHVS